MPKILLKFKDEVIDERTLGDSPLTIGRVAENDLVVDNLAVSRHHAKIFKEGDNFILEDLSSENGTFIKSNRVTHHTLQDKDEIVLGKHTLVFLMSDAPDSTTKKRIRQLTAPGKKFLPAEETLSMGNKAPTEKATLASCKIEIIEGETDTKEITLTKIMIVAGKENVDIKIKGNYEGNIAFIISNRGTGFWIAPSKSLQLSVDGQKVTEPIKLKNGNIIQANEYKIKFTN